MVFCAAQSASHLNVGYSSAVQDMSSNENMKKYFYTQQIYFSVQTTHSFTISPHLNSFGVHVTA